VLVKRALTRTISQEEQTIAKAVLVADFILLNTLGQSRVASQQTSGEPSKGRSSAGEEQILQAIQNLQTA